MATKTKKTDTKTEEAAPEPATEPRIVMPGGIAAEDLAVLDQPIDDRMAALLKDHQEMGSRPK